MIYYDERNCSGPV